MFRIPDQTDPLDRFAITHPSPEPAPSDPLAAWIAAPWSLWLLVAAWSQLAARVALVLPSVDPGRAIAYVVALHRHAVLATDETFTDLLAAELEPERGAADDALYPGDVIEPVPAYGFLAPATANAPLAGGPTFKRPDGTARGYRRIVVQGADGDGTHRAIESGELLARADLWAHGMGSRLPSLIGTDHSSWSEVVNLAPDEVTLSDGTRFVIRPYGAGDSIVGQGRKRRTLRLRKAQYAQRPDVDYRGWWPMIGARVIKRYHTALTIRTFTDERGRLCRERWVWVGNGPAIKRVTVKRTASTIAAAVPTANLATLRADLAAAFADQSRATRYVMTRDDTRITVTLERAQRRYSVAIKRGKDKSTTRKARTLDAVMRLASAA